MAMDLRLMSNVSNIPIGGSQPLDAKQNNPYIDGGDEYDSYD